MTQHTQSFSDVRALIEATIRARDLNGRSIYRIGGGHEAICYEFAGNNPALKPYLLRVVHDQEDAPNLDYLLEHSTYLTPVDRLVTGVHIGQTLMQLDTSGRISIVLRQPGNSFEREVQKELTSYRHPTQDSFRAAKALAEARAMVMENIVDSEKHFKRNPFEQIFRQGYELLYLGYRPDFRPGNLMISGPPGKSILSLVDQTNEPFERTSSRPLQREFNDAVNELLVELSKNIAPVGHYRDVRKEFDKLVITARDRVANEFAQGVPGNAKLSARPVTEVSNILLDGKVSTLVTALGATAQQTGVVR